MGRWGLSGILVPLLLVSGCANHRLETVRHESYSSDGSAVAAEAPPGFLQQLIAFQNLSAADRADLARRADAELEYWRDFQTGVAEHHNRQTRGWYYAGLSSRIRHLYGLGLVRSIDSLDSALELDPTNCEAWAAWGFLAQEVGDLERALTCLEKARFLALVRQEQGLSVDRKLYDQILVARAWALRDLARWEEGLRAVREGLEHHPGEPDLVLIKGLLLAGAGRYDEAVSLAVRMKPFEILDTRGYAGGLSTRKSEFANRWIKSQALLAIGEYAAAHTVMGDMTDYTLRNRIPHMSRFWNDMGVLAELAGAADADIYYSLAYVGKDYRSFYPIKPTTVSPAVLGVPDVHLPVFTSFGNGWLVAGSPFSYAVSQMNLMYLSVFDNQKQLAGDRAVQALDIAERRNIRPEICRALRGRIHFQRQQFGPAREDLSAAHEVFTATGQVDGRTSLLIGLLDLNDQRFEAAIPFCKEAVQAAEESALAWRSLGVAYSQAGYIVDAEQAMDRALVLEPNSVTGLYNRALFYCQMSRFSEAVRDLDQAYRLAPDSEQVQNLLQMAAANERVVGQGSQGLATAELDTADVPLGSLANADHDGDPQKLLARLLAELEDHFAATEGAVAVDSLAVLEALYAEFPDPGLRRELAVTYCANQDPGRVQTLLAPHWEGDLDPGEVILLLHAEQTLGQRTCATDLAAGLLDGSTTTDNPYLWALAVRGASIEPPSAQAGELQVAFERFVSFNVNFMGKPVEDWSAIYLAQNRQPVKLPDLADLPGEATADMPGDTGNQQH